MNQQDIVGYLVRAVETGSLEKTKKWLNSYRLSDFPVISRGLLLNALWRRNTEIAELLLSNNCSVNHENPQHQQTTPLHMAVADRDIKMVEMLLDRQAEVNVRDHKMRTPFMMAISNNEIETKEENLDVKCQLLIEKKKTHMKKRIDIIKLLIKSGADVNAGNTRFPTPLYAAVIDGNVEIMEILLNNHSDPNAMPGDDDDVDFDLVDGLLHYVVSRYRDDADIAITIVESLLNHGADPNHFDKYGRTPLHLSLRYKKLRISKILVDNHADVNAKDKNGLTPLHHAVDEMSFHKNLEITIAMINLLLENGANPNVYDKDGHTPLYRACRQWPRQDKDVKTLRNSDENRQIVDIFLSHGADLNGSIIIKGVRSPSPLQSAVASSCSPEFIEYLISKGAEVNPETDYESSPFYHAAKNGDEATVQVLLDHGAMMDPEGSNGESVLQVAVDSGCPRVVVRILLSFYANIENWSHTVKMVLRSFLAAFFFLKLRSWFKDRAGKNTGITENQYKQIVMNFLLDTYTYEHQMDVERYYSVEDKHAEQNSREAMIVMPLVADGIYIDFRSRDDRGMLCYAIKYGDVEMTKLCLKRQTKIDIDTFNIAVVTGRREMVDILLKHDPSIDLNANAHRITPVLCTAMGKNDFPFINEPDLIVDDDAKDDIARLLVARGAVVDNVWNPIFEYDSALIVATRNNRAKLVEFLMEHNAGQYEHIEDNNKQFMRDQPIHVAARNNQLDFIKIFLKRGIDVDLENYLGATALDIACREGHVEIVKFLLDQGASIKEFRSFEGTFFDPSTISSSEVHEALQRHVLRIIDTAECLLDGIEQRIYSHITRATFVSFVVECQEEAAKMRSEKIGNSKICFYDIFEKGIDQLTMYARNRSIRQAWESRDLGEEFPIHFNVMNINFSNGLKRVAFLDSAAKVFRTIRGCELMPELAIDYLFSYLDDEDISNLVEAGSNYNGQKKL